MQILIDYLALTGMTQVELAARCGTDSPHINKILRGTVDAGPKLIKKISEATNIKIERLIESAAA
jgi:transcriptional regulator with XRE-family HTH domain